MTETAKTKDDSTNYSSNPSTVNLDETFKEVYRQKRNSVLQSMMCKDIEEYIEKNMAEMHKALDELKSSFEEELNNIDRIIF
jgi:hypothetical protein